MSWLRGLIERGARGAPPEAGGPGSGWLQTALGSALTGALGGLVEAGVTVERDRALGQTAFWRAVQIIASAVGTLPLGVYRAAGAGQWLEERPPRLRAIWGRPNPEVPKSVFWTTAVMHAVATGNCFIYVVDAAGWERRTPGELWLIEPSRVRVGRDERGNKVYVIDGDYSRPRRDWVAGGDIVHIPGPTWDGLVGLSPLLVHARALGLSIAAEMYAARVLQNGSAPGGYLSTDQPLTREQAAQLAADWEALHRGPENAGRVAVLGRGARWLSVGLSPADAQLLATREYQVAEIARMFGVPLWLLDAHAKDTSWGSGLEEQNRAFLSYTLVGWIRRFEETITDELIPQEELVCRMDTSALTRGKLADQVSAARALVQAGYDPADVLAVVGLPPIRHTGRPPVGATDAPLPGEQGLAPMPDQEAPLPA